MKKTDNGFLIMLLMAAVFGLWMQRVALKRETARAEMWKAEAGMNPGTATNKIANKIANDPISLLFQARNKKEQDDFQAMRISQAKAGDLNSYIYLERIYAINPQKPQSEVDEMADVRTHWRWNGTEPVFVTNISIYQPDPTIITATNSAAK